MIAEIISTGTELLLGQIVNTTAVFLAKELNRLGFSVLYQTTVGDNPQRMKDVIAAALSRADMVVTTGGLGPTLGDITKQCAAEALEADMVFDESSALTIKRIFERRGLPMPERNLRQAYFPRGCEVVPNDYGTAPCVYFHCHYQGNEKLLVQLPGPPRELTGVFTDEIERRLVRDFGCRETIVSRVLKCHGIGESALEELLHEFVVNQSNPTVAFLAKESELHVRITARAGSEIEAQQLIDGLYGLIMPLIGKHVFAEDEDDIRHTLHKILTEKKITLAVAESCTGGLLAADFTSLPDSSLYFCGGVVAYANAVKKRALDVPEDIIAAHGAVSSNVAGLMAAGARRCLGADIGLATTGIAGPGGGTDSKPVGLVYVAISGAGGDVVKKLMLGGGREMIRKRAVKALQVELKKYLEEHYG